MKKKDKQKIEKEVKKNDTSLTQEDLYRLKPELQPDNNWENKQQ